MNLPKKKKTRTQDYHSQRNKRKQIYNDKFQHKLDKFKKVIPSSKLVFDVKCKISKSNNSKKKSKSPSKDKDRKKQGRLTPKRFTFQKKKLDSKRKIDFTNSIRKGVKSKTQGIVKKTISIEKLRKPNQIVLKKNHCSYHPTSKSKYFFYLQELEDQKVEICDICKTQFSKQGYNVYKISKINQSLESLYDADQNQLLKDIDIYMNQFCFLKSKVKKSQNDNQQTCELQKEQIKKFFGDIIEVFQQKRNLALKNVQRIFDSKQKNLKLVSSLVKRNLKDIDELRKSLDNSRKDLYDKNIYTKVDYFKRILKTYEYDNFDLKPQINFENLSYQIFNNFDTLWNKQIKSQYVTNKINSIEKYGKKISSFVMQRNNPSPIHFKDNAIDIENQYSSSKYPQTQQNKNQKVDIRKYFNQSYNIYISTSKVST